MHIRETKKQRQLLRLCATTIEGSQNSVHCSLNIGDKGIFRHALLFFLERILSRRTRKESLPSQIERQMNRQRLVKKFMVQFPTANKAKTVPLVHIHIQRNLSQRPPWGQKKVAVVERWSLWRDRGVIWHLFLFLGCNIFCQKILILAHQN